MRLSLTAITIVMLLGCKPREAQHTHAKREDAQVATPEHDAMTAHPRYLIVQIRCTVEPRRPELAAITARDVMLAIPEHEVVTFERELDKSMDQRLVVFGRGWKVGSDELVETDMDVWCRRRGGTLVGASQLGAALGEVARTGVNHAEDGYLERTEVRFVEITSAPSVEALRGVPDSVGEQEAKQRSWTTWKAPTHP